MANTDTTNMKAIIWTHYGPPEVLQLQDVRKPSPKDNELRIKIYASTVTAGDCEMRSLKIAPWLRLPLRLYYGFKKPTKHPIPGQEVAGIIDAVGKNVTRYKPGDHVFGTTGIGFGACAEYVCLPENGMEVALIIKPTNMNYTEAAAVPIGGLNALHFLRKAHIQIGQKVLIIGAGGSIGTMAIQLAKHYGAEVMAVDSTAKLAMLRNIGADHVIDFTQEDFATTGGIYDVIFDVVCKNSFSRCIRALKTNGIYLVGNPSLSQSLRGLWISLTKHKKVISGTASYTTDDLLFLKGLIEAGKIRSVIDKSFPLEQTAEAHKYVETGQKLGNVVIIVRNESNHN